MILRQPVTQVAAGIGAAGTADALDGDFLDHHMRCLDDTADNPVRIGCRHHQGDATAIAVTDQNGAVDAGGVHDLGQHLVGFTLQILGIGINLTGGIAWQRG